MRRLLVCVALAAGLAVPSVSLAAQTNVPASLAPETATGLAVALPATTGAAGSPRVVKTVQVTQRLTELTVSSPILGRDTSLRVLLPKGFDATSPALPVLWLLHGGNDDFRSWTTKGAAEAITDGLPLIVVMPDSGPGGWYSDWFSESMNSQGRQRWESLHVDELRRFIEARYRSRTDRAGRSVVGLSMGGFGSASYAARHPDLYGFAAALSGAVNVLSPPVSAVTDASPLVQGGQPGDIWGNRIAHETNWRAHNPVDLAANLRTVEFQLRTGNGQPGGKHGGGPDVTEAGVHRATLDLHARLDELGVRHVFQDYGPGAHDWPYWQDDLRATLPRLMAVATEAAPAPVTTSHISFEPTYSVWKHDVQLQRPVLQTSQLDTRPTGFTVRGTGAGTVTAPVACRPGQAVAADIVVDEAAPKRLRLVCDRTRRVRVPVDLGPASQTDEYPLGAAIQPAFVTNSVVLRPLAAGAQDRQQARPPARPAVAQSLAATGGRPSAAAAGSTALLLAAFVHARRRRVA